MYETITFCGTVPFRSMKFLKPLRRMIYKGSWGLPLSPFDLKKYEGFPTRILVYPVHRNIKYDIFLNINDKIEIAQRKGNTHCVQCTVYINVFTSHTFYL
jgi:hypothetical protein